MAKLDYFAHAVAAMQANREAHIAHEGDVGVVLTEEKCLGYVNLRLRATDTIAKIAVKTALSIELPNIEQVARNKMGVLVGYSPSEWLIVTPAGEETQLIQLLGQKLQNTHSALTDVTGGMTQLNVTGKRAQDLLEKGTYVDLHPSVFQSGRCYHTQIAHAPVTIIKNDDRDFSLLVRRSFANHIADWALDGAREYGVTFS